MKIAYRHLLKCIVERPSVEELSEKLFQLGHEHEFQDGIFDMEFTPNRGDCLSVNGLLRDLSAFHTIQKDQKIFNSEIENFPIDFKNLSKDICPEISFLKLEIEQIPHSYNGDLEEYFLDLNLKKNNFFTDISNFLSYETGQPTHCYDATKLNGELVFDNTHTDEEFNTLLGSKINLMKDEPVFLLNDEVINFAGVVGGQRTSCSKKTKTVIIECAYFQPEAIIGKSIKYDIHSEASHKFERGVDRSCHNQVLRRFMQIVGEHSNIKYAQIASFKYNNKEEFKIPFDINKINHIIGININDQKYHEILTSLGFNVVKDYIVVPSHRNDVRTQNDLAEEVARVIGYDNIERTPIEIPQANNLNNNEFENKLRFFLLDNGFYEVINSPFVSVSTKNAIKVDNPLDSNRKFLRTNITNSLLDNLLFNERRQKDSIKLFEISDVYFNSEDCKQVKRLSLIASGRVGLNYVDFSKKINKKYLENIFKEIFPYKSLNFKVIPRADLDTKIQNEIISLEVDIKELSNEHLDYKEKSKSPVAFNQYEPISELPSSFKDVSYSTKNPLKVKELQEYLYGYQNKILKDLYIFDYFSNEKNNETKIGFRFIFQSNDQTLTSEKIDEVLSDIIETSLKIGEISIPGYVVKK
jgi:phenylalanyl-tRNA synthetase beta chain